MTSLIGVGPLLYQLLHPWHWLTYGQNTSAVALIVIVFYTIYTRRMMLLAQQTRRGELYPLLALQNAIVKNGSMDLVIVNVGAGPLLNALQWGQPVSERFQLGETFLERPPATPQSFGGSMLRGEGRTLSVQVDGSEPRVLLVVEGTDSFGGRHQFCLLRSLAASGEYEHQVRMVHPVDFLPLWRRVAWKLREWRARLQLWTSKRER
jgi:hypothetical protein